MGKRMLTLARAVKGGHVSGKSDAKWTYLDYYLSICYQKAHEAENEQGADSNLDIRL